MVVATIYPLRAYFCYNNDIMAKKLNISFWDKYWRLTIIEEVEKRVMPSRKSRQFLCRCECWNIKKYVLNDIRKWKSNSCWCLAIELKTKHWCSKTKLYKVYRWLKWRCNNPNTKSYKNYWWRWIKCEWKTFEQFYEDMNKGFLEHYKKNWNDTQIDRIDVNWNYCKSNCRWVTNKINCNNRRNNIVYNGKNITQWSVILWKRPWVIYDRYNKLWWDLKKAIFY